MLLAVASLGIFISCKKDKKGPSARDQAISALVDGTWTIASSSTSSAAGITVEDITIDFSGTSTISFVLAGGGIDDNATTGGTFEVSETGAITDLVMTSAGEVEVSSSASATLSGGNTTFTLDFDTEESSARVSGLGSYNLIFNSGS